MTTERTHAEATSSTVAPVEELFAWSGGTWVSKCLEILGCSILTANQNRIMMPK